MSDSIFTIGEKATWNRIHKPTNIPIYQGQYCLGNTFEVVRVEEIPDDLCSCRSRYPEGSRVCPNGICSRSLRETQGHSQWVYIRGMKGTLVLSGVHFKKM